MSAREEFEKWRNDNPPMVTNAEECNAAWEGWQACAQLKDKDALRNFRPIADAQLEHGLRIDVLRAERERNLESIRQGNDIIARQRVELAEITDLRDMIILCGEEECRDVVGYVSWSSIKEIHKAVVALFALSPENVWMMSPLEFIEGACPERIKE